MRNAAAVPVVARNLRLSGSADPGRPVREEVEQFIRRQVEPRAAPPLR
jgi:hypothetical protein